MLSLINLPLFRALDRANETRWEFAVSSLKRQLSLRDRPEICSLSRQLLRPNLIGENRQKLFDKLAFLGRILGTVARLIVLKKVNYR